MPVLTAAAQPSDTPPAVVLNLLWDGPADPVDGWSTELTISRRDSDRSRPVRGCEPLTVTSTDMLTVYDYEAPFGVPVRYEATGADGYTAISGDVVLNPTAWYPNDLDWSTERGAVWLRHLTIPQLSMPVDLADADSPAYAQTRTVLAVLNRREPIVLTDARRKAFTSSLTIRTWSLEESARLRELLADNSVLLLSIPAAERWGLTQHYVAVGDVTEERLVQEWAPFEGRSFSLPVEIVERPTGGVVFGPCCYWAEQRATPSYLAINERYGSYGALARCDPAYVPPDVPPVAGDTLAYLYRTDNQGMYLPPVRRVTGHVRFPVRADTTYRVEALQWFTEAAGDVTLETRYSYGSYAGPSIGLPVASATLAADQWTTPLMPVQPQGTFWAQTDGTVTVVMVVKSAEVVSDASSEPDLPRVLIVTEEGGSQNPGGEDPPPDGGTWMGWESAMVTASDGTYGTPVEVITISLGFDAYEGSTFRLTAWHWITAAPSGVTLELRYGYGSLGPDTGTVAGVRTEAGFDDPGFPTTVQVAGDIVAPADGRMNVIAVLRSDGPVVDATDDTYSRNLTVHMRV